MHFPRSSFHPTRGDIYQHSLSPKLSTTTRDFQMIHIRSSSTTCLKTCCSQVTGHKRYLATKRIEHNSAQYILDLVKKNDYENYLATILIFDRTLRRSACAFRALNVELAQVLDVTSKPIAAQGRFLYWSEILEEVYSGNSNVNAKNSPVAAELIRALKAVDGNLSKRHFKKLISCRDSTAHLSSFPFETVQQLQDYSESSIGPVYNLIIESWIGLNKKSNNLVENVHVKLDHIANHLATCQGISNVLRGVVHNARSGRCYISSDLLSKHRATHTDFCKYRSKKEVFDVSYDLATIANDHLKIVKDLMKDRQVKSALPLFYPIISVEKYLKKLEECNFDIFHKDLYKKTSNPLLKLWWETIKMRINQV